MLYYYVDYKLVKNKQKGMEEVNKYKTEEEKVVPNIGKST